MDITIPKDVGISKFYTNTNKKEEPKNKPRTFWIPNH